MATRVLHISDLHVGTQEAPTVESALEKLIERLEPELVIASGDLTHRGRPEQHAAAATFLRSLGLARAGDPRKSRHSVHVPGEIHAHVRRVRAPLGDHRARLQLGEPVRDRAQLGARLATPVGRNPRGAAPARLEAPRRGSSGHAARRHHASPDDRRALAVAKEAGRAAIACPGRARRRRCGTDPGRPHPPGRGGGATRVRGRRREG